jgi:predicted transcriptional regulator
MTEPLPHLSDVEKQKLVEELEAMGLLRRDANGRRWLTERGDTIGMALHAFAAIEQAERELAEREQTTPPLQ